MGRNLFQMLGDDGADSDGDDRWMIAVEAIVAENEDPEHQHRIKVIIPLLDENNVRDEWVRQMGCYVGGPGYGSFLLPAIGSEVVLFGRLGQKYNLFYMSVYNEDYVVPADFRDTSVCGIRAPGQLKLIADQLMQLRGSRLRIEADASIQITAPGGVFINDRQY